MLVANPADRQIYYTEGMAAPMGVFKTTSAIRERLVMDNSLRETARGVYSTTARLNNAEAYDVAFPSTRRGRSTVSEIVAENPNAPKKLESSFKIEPVVKEAVARPANASAFASKWSIIKPEQRKPDGSICVLVFLRPAFGSNAFPRNRWKTVY